MDADVKARVQAVTDASNVSFDKAAQYDTAVLGLGYVAFFALWGGVSKDIPKWAALASAALIAASLLCYICWLIVQMLGRHKGSEKMMALVKENGGVWRSDFVRRWDDAAAAQQRAMALLLKIWLPLFYASFILGLIGGGLLSGVAGYQAIHALTAPAAKPPSCTSSAETKLKGRPATQPASKPKH